MSIRTHIATAAEIRRSFIGDDAGALDAVYDAIHAIEDAHARMHSQAGTGALSASEQREWDALTERRTELESYRDELEAIAGAERAARAQRIADSRARWGSLHIEGPSSKASEYTGREGRMAGHEARDAALHRLEGRSAAQHLAPEQLDRLDSLIRAKTTDTDGTAIARMVLMTENDAYRSAFQEVMTNPNPILTNEEAHALRQFREFRAMSIGTDNAGGYGVPVLIDPTIVMSAQGSSNPFWRLARVETITTDAWKGVTSDGVSWSYDDEAEEVSDDTPTLAQPTVPTHMARGFVPFSIEVGMDYPNFAQEMSRLLAEGYSELNAQKFVSGSGTGEPTGVITALDANTNVEVVTTTDGSFGAPDLKKVWNALPDRFKGNATWVMSHAVGDDIAEFGNGNNLSFVTVDLTNTLTTLRRRPVEYSSYFPGSLATTGAANILVVGDFRNFLIAQRAGMTVELVPHLFGTTNQRPTGQRGWFAWARTGSKPIVDNAFRLLQNQ